MESNVEYDDELDIRFMNRRKFLHITRLSPYRMKKLIEKGRLRAVKVDNYYLLEKESVKELLGLTPKIGAPEKHDLFTAA